MTKKFHKLKWLITFFYVFDIEAAEKGIIIIESPTAEASNSNPLSFRPSPRPASNEKDDLERYPIHAPRPAIDSSLIGIPIQLREVFDSEMVARRHCKKFPIFSIITTISDRFDSIMMETPLTNEIYERLHNVHTLTFAFLQQFYNGYVQIFTKFQKKLESTEFNFKSILGEKSKIIGGLVKMSEAFLKGGQTFASEYKVALQEVTSDPKMKAWLLARVASCTESGEEFTAYREGIKTALEELSDPTISDNTEGCLWRNELFVVRTRNLCVLMQNPKKYENPTQKPTTPKKEDIEKTAHVQKTIGRSWLSCFGLCGIAED